MTCARGRKPQFSILKYMAPLVLWVNTADPTFLLLSGTICMQSAYYMLTKASSILPKNHPIRKLVIRNPLGIGKLNPPTLYARRIQKTLLPRIRFCPCEIKSFRITPSSSDLPFGINIKLCCLGIYRIIRTLMSRLRQSLPNPDGGSYRLVMPDPDILQNAPKRERKKIVVSKRR